MIRRGDLTAYLQTFLLTCKVDGLSPATLIDYRQKIGAFVSFCASLGVKDPKRLTDSDVRMYLAKLRETVSPVSVGDYYRCVKRFLNWMVEERVLKYNPMATIRHPKVPKKIIVPFTTERLCIKSPCFQALLEQLPLLYQKSRRSAQALARR
jgi:integrase/recombinase XerD